MTKNILKIAQNFASSYYKVIHSNIQRTQLHKWMPSVYEKDCTLRRPRTFELHSYQEEDTFVETPNERLNIINKLQYENYTTRNWELDYVTNVNGSSDIVKFGVKGILVSNSNSHREFIQRMVVAKQDNTYKLREDIFEFLYKKETAGNIHYVACGYVACGTSKEIFGYTYMGNLLLGQQFQKFSTIGYVDKATFCNDLQLMSSGAPYFPKMFFKYHENDFKFIIFVEQLVGTIEEYFQGVHKSWMRTSSDKSWSKWWQDIYPEFKKIFNTLLMSLAINYNYGNIHGNLKEGVVLNEELVPKFIKISKNNYDFEVAVVKELKEVAEIMRAVIDKVEPGKGLNQLPVEFKDFLNSLEMDSITKMGNCRSFTWLMDNHVFWDPMRKAKFIEELHWQMYSVRTLAITKRHVSINPFKGPYQSFIKVVLQIPENDPLREIFESSSSEGFHSIVRYYRNVIIHYNEKTANKLDKDEIVQLLDRKFPNWFIDVRGGVKILLENKSSTMSKEDLDFVIQRLLG